MGYVSQAIVDALRQPGNLGLFWRLDVDPVVRFWMGVAPIKAGIAALDSEGDEYIGGGQLLQLSDMDILINGQAGRAEFFVSGIPTSYTANFASEMPDVSGKKLHIGFALLDDHWQATTAIVPLTTAIADYWALKQEDEGGEDETETESTVTLILSVRAGDTARASPQLVSWTPQQHRLLSSDDAFCDRVNRYDDHYEVTWPRF